MKTLSKKTVTFMLSMVLLFVAIAAPISDVKTASAASIDISYYEDFNFTFQSIPEPRTLRENCDTISLYATCTEEGVTDELICYVINMNNPTISGSFSFTADGSVTTYQDYFPAGRYNIYFIGSSDIEKDYGVAIFSKFI